MRPSRRLPLLVCVIAVAGSLGACSFLTTMSGTTQSGRVLSGHLSGAGITFKSQDGLNCDGRYLHHVYGGVGALRCDDGRTGEFTLSSWRHAIGPGHGRGQGEGRVGDEKFEFSY